MNRDIIFIESNAFKTEFKRLSKKYHSLPDDINRIKQQIAENPEFGVDLGSGVKKIRFAIKDKNKGKSGGGRIITLNTLIKENKIALVILYDKSEFSNISDGFIKSIIKEEFL